MIRDVTVDWATMRVELHVPAQPGIKRDMTLTMRCAEENLQEHRNNWPEMVNLMVKQALDGFFSRLSEIKQ